MDGPAHDASIDVVLREASRAFGAPVALLPEAAGGPALRSHASAAVTGCTGERLGTLCLLGQPAAGPIDAWGRLQLQKLASRAAAALQRRASA